MVAFTVFGLMIKFLHTDRLKLNSVNDLLMVAVMFVAALPTPWLASSVDFPRFERTLSLKKIYKIERNLLRLRCDYDNVDYNAPSSIDC